MFKVGDTCYFLVSNSKPVEGKIIARNGTLYTIKYDGDKGIRLKEHRLYRTLEDIPKPKPMFRSPYDYPH